ncbi:putative bifunctional diguanylate cyclase/phosphodiesterase [Massilia sp. TSP1-1-2]|uniref:putative bifunctional diguanylate cyclase/phosphodiesterase n=1 Tax=unclassified Massilia TaxID=2609279 RepID=UPI003CFAF5A0
MKLEPADQAPSLPLSTLDLLQDQIAVIDASGVIVSINHAWIAFARANGADLSAVLVGANYLDACARAAVQGDGCASAAADLIRDILSGRVQHASLEYPCDSPTEERWYRLKLTGVHAAGARHVVAVHEEIAGPNMADRQMRLQQNLLASVEQAVIATDLAGTILFWNPFAERLYGWPAAEVLGRNIVDVTPTELNQTQAVDIMARLQQGESWSGDFDVRHRSGRILPVHVTDSPLRNERQQLIGVIGISTDMTEKRKTDKALRLSDMVYQAIGEAIMVVCMNGRIEAINPAFTMLTGYTEEEVIGHDADLLKGGAEHLIGADAEQLLGRTGHWAGSLRIRLKSAEISLKWLRIDTIYDQHKRDKLRICMFSHVTDQKRANETIWRQANFDMLTGLPNRSMFRDRLEHEIQKAGRAGHRLALMFIDLDQFKEVNDTLGHEMGDSLLKQAAGRLASCVRGADTVARIGGDEFTVILGELEDPAVVERVASTIVQTMALPFYVAQNTIYVSASVGITLFPEDAREADGLIRNADQAMYAAKNHGRDRFHYFTQRMQNEALGRMRMINDLRGALANDQFELRYQPIVALADGAIHKAEALLRWRHPVRGMVSPLEFITVAEQTGMITAIGEWVYQRASQQAHIWRKIADPQFKVSVNLSPVQLRQNGGGGGTQFASQSVGKARPPSGGAGAILEITEGLLLESSKAVMEQLQGWRDAGGELAIDDFGTGYSALSYLRKFHVDYLKIDQTFVRGLSAHSDDLTMCEAIIAMAHKLGIRVIAEGIERQEQRDLLAHAGCDFGQGFLFSHPLVAADMGALLGH